MNNLVISVDTFVSLQYFVPLDKPINNTTALNNEEVNIARIYYFYQATRNNCGERYQCGLGIDMLFLNCLSWRR